jgi:hypothetical protein
MVTGLPKCQVTLFPNFLSHIFAILAVLKGFIFGKIKMSHHTGGGANVTK